MLINKKLIRFNYMSRSGEKIKYIVVHDTGNTRKSANAINHYRYFNAANRRASAHYFVDSDGIVQTVEDANASWHCGDGRGRFGITNKNSIGIEICVNEDGDYEKALLHAKELIRELMAFYGIDKNHVVRHFDASRKNCPQSMSANNWKKWQEFKDGI